MEVITINALMHRARESSGTIQGIMITMNVYTSFKVIPGSQDTQLFSSAQVYLVLAAYGFS